MKKRIFFDMDGVLAIWNTAASIEETAEKGYFAKREKEYRAVELVKMLVGCGYDVNILSSVYRDGHSANDKKEWLKTAGLSELNRIFVPYGEKKREYIEKEKNEVCFLIDDFTKNLKEFEEGEGCYGIKFFNGINGTHGTWNGFAISNKMTPDRMFVTIRGIVDAIGK